MKNHLVRAIILLLALLLIGIAAVFAMDDSDAVMPFTAELANSSGAPVPDGPYTITFSIYADSIGGSARWTETHTVNTVGGMFKVELGETNKIPDSTMNSPKVFLGIKVAGDDEMTPRTKLGAVPFSRITGTVQGDINTHPGGLDLIDTTDDGDKTSMTAHGISFVNNNQSALSADATAVGGTITIGNPSVPGDSIRLGPPDTVFRGFKNGKMTISANNTAAGGSMEMIGTLDDGIKTKMDPHGIELFTGARASMVAGLSADGLTLTTGAADGYVLTSDASGLGTWRPATGGGSCWACPANYTYLSDINDSVGIGTSQPTAKLHVMGNGYEEVKVESGFSFGEAGFTAKTNGNAYDYFTLTKYAPSAGGTTVGLPLANLSLLRAGAGAGPMLIHVVGNNSMHFATYDQERMRITADGNVGIGTTGPTAKLEVAGTGYAIMGTSSSGTGAGVSGYSNGWHAVLGVNSNANAALMGRNDGSGPALKAQNQGTGVAIQGWTESGNLLELYDTPTLRLTVDNGGNLTTSGNIDMGGFKMSTGASDGYVLTSNASGTGTWKAATGGGSCWSCDDSTVWLADTTNRVAIGTPNATANLDVDVSGGIGMRAAEFRNNYGAAGVNAATVTIENKSTNGPGMFVYTNSSDANVVITNDNASGQLLKCFGPGGAVKFRVNANGKVGINNDSPTAALDVIGSTGHNQVRMRTSYTPTGTADANGNVGDIAWDSNYMYVKTAAGWKRAALSTW